jgi:hypothetical protein
VPIYNKLIQRSLSKSLGIQATLSVDGVTAGDVYVYDLP